MTQKSIIYICILFIYVLMYMMGPRRNTKFSFRLYNRYREIASVGIFEMENELAAPKGRYIDTLKLETTDMLMILGGIILRLILVIHNDVA